MSASSSELILRVYHGRENGLMVIGSADVLAQLGTQLQAAAVAHGNTRPPDWPPMISSPTVSGPYLDEPSFKLSFHVLPAAGVPKSLPSRRRGIPIALSLAFGALALIGAAALALWVVR
jgi:hypothetical protein